MAISSKDLERLPEHVQRFVKAQLGGKPTQRRASKYNAVKTEIDGVTLDSKKEAKSFVDFQLLLKAGDIQWYCRQPIFDLEGGRYRPDFIVCWKDGTVEIIDVKGVKTPQYLKCKRQMMERYGIEVIEK